MNSDARASARSMILAAIWLGVAGLGVSACTALAGLGTAAAVVGIGAATSRCYDYLDVSVFDGQGRKTCAATVTARNGGSSFELASCYYAQLTDGRWTLQASSPSGLSASSVVDVDHKDGCVRHVQTVELTLGSTAATARAPRALPASPPTPVAAPPPLPAGSAPLPAELPAPASSAPAVQSSSPNAPGAPATPAAPANPSSTASSPGAPPASSSSASAPPAPVPTVH